MKALPTLFTILGVILLLVGSYQLYLKYSPNRLSFKNYPQQVKAQTVTDKKPRYAYTLGIPALGINVPLLPANVTNDVWETTEYGASYLVSSPLPGETGNSIIYGHNWTSIFGNLMRAKPGQIITIESADGTKKTFVIEYTSLVSPDESSILAPSKDKRVTLYTCTGLFDSKRFVVVGILKEDE